MNFFTNFFKQKEHPAPQPLAIEGILPAPITPEPDDAELAAQALLEMMASVRRKPLKGHTPGSEPVDSADGERTAEYYQTLAKKIRQARQASALRATRFVAACECTLENKHLPYYGAGSLSMMEAELYKRIDIIEHEGGELKRRWQHCLAEVTVRLMDAPPTE